MERDAVMEEAGAEAGTAGAAESEAAQIVPSSSYVAIEFPGYVRNVARATRMLGGLESIAAAMCSTPPASFLKLSFRPEDPMAHPLFGNHEQTRGLVLRVSRPRRHGGGTGDAHAGGGDAATASDAMQHDGVLAEGDEPPPKVQVVAQVSSTYRYTGMADYQFLPLDPGHAARYQAARAASGPDQGTAPLPVPYENSADVAEPSGAPEPLLVVPPVFAKSDVPMDYAFKQFKMPVAKGAVTTSVQEVGFHIPSVPQPEPARDAPAEVPAEAAAAGTAAAAETAAEAGAEGAATGTDGAAAGADGEAASASADPKSRLLAELSALLEQRPVWSRQLLTETLKHAGGPPGTAALQQQPVASTSAAAGGSAAAAAGQLQACLAQLTYRFKAGPWRHLYIRRGYDPRQQPESRRYQLLLYKLPTTWFQHLAAARAAQQPPAAAASVGKAGTGAKAGAKGAAAVAGDGKAAEAAAGGESAAAAAGGGTAGRKSLADAAAAPGAPPPSQPAGGPSMAQLHAFQELPTSSTTELQLCDLEDDTVRRWLAAPPADRCTEADGWFAKAALPEMQAAVNAHFQRLLDNLTPPVAPQQPAKRKGGRKSKKELAAAAAAAGGRAKDGTAAAAAAVPESREAKPLAGPNEAAKPPSFLSTLMEQMALQHNAGQDDQDDEYKLLEDSGNEEDDDDEGPVVGFASGPAGLVPTGAAPAANGSLPHTAVAALGNGGVAASAEQAGEQGEEEAEEEEAGEGEFDEEEEEDYY